MSIRKLRAGRVPTVTRSQYIGEKGTIFWDELTGELFLSDGVTQGGHDIGLPPASSSRLGGVKLGPGVVLNPAGQIIIDSTGLSFNFGDFYAFINDGELDGACLSSINENQDVNIVSNGTGSVNLVGEFNVHKPSTTIEAALEAVPIFKVTTDGQVQMLVPKADLVGGALEIVGNSSGVFFPPDQTGVILHVTGNSGLTARNYFDANANYALLAGRRYNGPQNNPTRVLAGEVLFRIVGQAAVQATTERASFNSFGPARIEFRATEDQYPTAQGGEVRIFATANGSVASSTNTLVATFNATTGLTANKFVGPLTGNVTGKADTAGNADTVTNGVYTNGSYANPSWITSLAASKVGLGSVENTALSTSTHYIGTTSIQYNRASASQTLTGVSIDGNAGTATNGVVTTGSYSDPSWLTISKSKVGLSNVDNTTDASKNVLYAATAGGAPATDVYAWAKAATKPTYTKSEVGLSAVENTALSTWAGTSSITTVGTLGSLSVTATITGSVSGNAGTVTNGVYTNGSYANPAWITSLAASKIGLGNVENTALSTSTHYIGTTSIQYNRASASQSLTGVSIDGSAGSVAAANITGTTLASNVVTSSLTSLGGMSTIKAGTISAAFTVAKNTPISTQTFTVSGLTTSHKIIITSNTAMPDETYFIPAAWVSATNTVSIQIAHTGGQAFSATFNISYFAWV
jgi:hypothetical protein